MVPVVWACLEKSIVSVYLALKCYLLRGKNVLLGVQNEHKCTRGCLQERTEDQRAWHKTRLEKKWMKC